MYVRMLTHTHTHIHRLVDLSRERTSLSLSKFNEYYAHVVLMSLSSK